MDDNKLNEMKKELFEDNNRIEEILKKEMTPQMEAEFFEELKKSQLFLPVSYSPNMFEGIENAKEGDIFETPENAGFDINYLTDSEGNKAVPLFTSDEVMKEAGVNSSVMVMNAEDLADMLKQSDRYSIIAINPFTPHGVNMPIEVFFRLFEKPTEEEKKFLDTLKLVLKALKEDYVELEKDIAFMYRSDENVMVEKAVDGFFIPKMPFKVSSHSNYGKGLKYTNILLMPKSSKILPLGPELELDIIIAPESEFKLMNELDEFTTVWKCEAQPFYDENK